MKETLIIHYSNGTLVLSAHGDPLIFTNNILQLMFYLRDCVVVEVRNIIGDFNTQKGE
jgi:hypothetical protein